MKLGKKIAAVSMAAALAVSMSIPSFAYGEVTGSSTLVSDTQATSEYQTWKKNVWDAGARANSANIVMTPGATAKDLNFAWYSEAKGTPAVKISKSKDMSNATVFTGEALTINRKNTSGKTYTAANHVSVEGFFEENTTYYYSYTSDTAKGEWSEAEEYHTYATSSFQTILVGDPQVGASGSTGQGTQDDVNIAVDTYNWNKTLEQAMETASNASFILSAGDQIDYSNADSADTAGIRESEYAGFLYPETLRELPVATTIGNHESKGTDYQYHYNNPNSEDNLGATQSGSDYYFSYGDVLFISLNSNNRNVSEHRALMEKAIASHEDAKWKVVMFHHDIYGSGQPHSDTDGANLRVLFAPLMDEFDIDVCLTGHDHSYARTFQLLDGNAIDYGTQNTVADPEGTMYIAAGSASGSKFYNLASTKQYYIAERSNAQFPTFSTIDFTSNSMTIKTYDYNGDKYADDFTITKNVDEASLLELVNQAETMDTSAYTSGTVAAMNTAVKAVKALLETQEDLGAAKLEESYNAELNTDSTTDPLNYYGYAQDLTGFDGENYKRNGTKTLKEGFSTLLDKTLNNSQEKLSATELSNAYTTLATAISELAKTTDAQQLDQAVADAQSKYDNAVEGTEVGQYKEGAKAALKTAIDAAKAVADNDAATASEIAEATSSLAAAVKAFDAAKVTETVTPAPDDNNSQKPDDNNNSQVPGDDDSQAPSENDGSNPNTGDHTSMGVVAGLAALCVVSGGTVIYLRKRSHKSEQ